MLPVVAVAVLSAGGVGSPRFGLRLSLSAFAFALSSSPSPLSRSMTSRSRPVSLAIWPMRASRSAVALSVAISFVSDSIFLSAASSFAALSHSPASYLAALALYSSYPAYLASSFAFSSSTRAASAWLNSLALSVVVFFALSPSPWVFWPAGGSPSPPCGSPPSMRRRWRMRLRRWRRMKCIGAPLVFAHG